MPLSYENLPSKELLVNILRIEFKELDYDAVWTRRFPTNRLRYDAASLVRFGSDIPIADRLAVVDHMLESRFANRGRDFSKIILSADSTTMQKESLGQYHLYLISMQYVDVDLFRFLVRVNQDQRRISPSAQDLVDEFSSRYPGEQLDYITAEMIQDLYDVYVAPSSMKATFNKARFIEFGEIENGRIVGRIKRTMYDKYLEKIRNELKGISHHQESSHAILRTDASPQALRGACSDRGGAVSNPLVVSSRNDPPRRQISLLKCHPGMVKMSGYVTPSLEIDLMPIRERRIIAEIVASICEKGQSPLIDRVYQLLVERVISESSGAKFVMPEMGESEVDKFMKYLSDINTIDESVLSKLVAYMNASVSPTISEFSQLIDSSPSLSGEKISNWADLIHNAASVNPDLNHIIDVKTSGKVLLDIHADLALGAAATRHIKMLNQPPPSYPGFDLLSQVLDQLEDKSS